MASKFSDIAFTDSVKEVQSLMGSRKNYARSEKDPVSNQELTENEFRFISERDSFYMASISETGWPYVQYRGGPAGFVRRISSQEIGFADFSGNRQYISIGNLNQNRRVALILVDYPSQSRLKILGEARIVEAKSDPDLLAKLVPTDYKARVEWFFVIKVEGYDWNCPQHITPRWTAEEIQMAMAPLKKKIQDLENELASLKE